MKSNFKFFFKFSRFGPDRFMKIERLFNSIIQKNESRFEVFNKYFRKLTLPITGDYVDDDFRFIDSLKYEE
jgi:hypothetical protein